MKTKILFFALAIMVLMTGCPSITGCLQTHDYVSDILENHRDLKAIPLESNAIAIGMVTPEQRDSDYTGFITEKQRRQEREHLKRLHQFQQEVGDVGFPETTDQCIGPTRPASLYYNVYLENSLVRINIVAKEDWDSEHPTGSLLDDQFLLLTYSCDKYVKQKFRISDKDVAAHKATVQDPFFKELDDKLRKARLYRPDPLAICGLVSEKGIANYRLINIPGITQPFLDKSVESNFQVLVLKPVNPNVKGKSIEIQLFFRNKERLVLPYTFN